MFVIFKVSSFSRLQEEPGRWNQANGEPSLRRLLRRPGEGGGGHRRLQLRDETRQGQRLRIEVGTRDVERNGRRTDEKGLKTDSDLANLRLIGDLLSKYVYSFSDKCN